MLVATVDRGRAASGPDSDDDATPDAAGKEADEQTLVPDGAEDIMQALHDGSCHRYEHWLAVAAGPRWTSQLLFASCNDGNGAAGVGEDRVAVADGGVEIEHSGGSNWRWDGTYDVSLDPPQVRSLKWSGNFCCGSQAEDGTWDWDRFGGQVKWTAPHCKANGDPPDDETEPRDDETYTFDLIPLLALDPAFTESGWRTTALGRCAAQVDSSGSNGFVTFGDLGAADDASLRVVASKGVLYLEIHDDQWVGPSNQWVADDHVELWISREEQTYMGRCLARSDAAAKQWAVRIADGQVFGGYGHPDPGEIQVARATAPGVTRLRITLPREIGGVTVVYSDGDDGKRQKRLIATSDVRFGAGETLGRFYPIRPDQAVCETRNGRLEPRLVTPRRPRDHAVVGEEGQ
jgi:hypothetical protein